VSELAEDPRFAQRQARLKNRLELDAIVIRCLAQRTVAEWVETLNEAGVACGPILMLDQVFADPQVQQAGLIHEQPSQSSGAVKVLGLPISLSRTPPTVRTAAAIRGAHTHEVLASLGYSATDIHALVAAGVIEVQP
jgi:crotonobetainyl-CoA:carnitine CoA-transferase CaiB-like acyl-CoA transferase